MNPWEAPGMSPEERSYAICRHWDDLPGGVQDAITDAIRAAEIGARRAAYRDDIAQTEEAIRLAVAEEREACARVAEERAAQHYEMRAKLFTRPTLTMLGHREDEAGIIARAIRTAKEGSNG